MRTAVLVHEVEDGIEVCLVEDDSHMLQSFTELVMIHRAVKVLIEIAKDLPDVLGLAFHLRVRVQLIRHLKTCTTDIYLNNDCAHVGSSIHAPIEAEIYSSSGREDKVCM